MKYKYNVCYRYNVGPLALAPNADPSPMTREGTHALVERYHALKISKEGHPPQVGIGGFGSPARTFVVPPVQSLKPKSNHVP